MESVEQFRGIRVGRCDLFSVPRGLRFDFRFRTAFHKVRMRVGEAVHKIAQNCEELICGRS